MTALGKAIRRALTGGVGVWAELAVESRLVKADTAEAAYLLVSIVEGDALGDGFSVKRDNASIITGVKVVGGLMEEGTMTEGRWSERCSTTRSPESIDKCLGVLGRLPYAR